MKKVTAFVLALTMISSLFLSGCGDKTSSAAGSAPSGNTGSSAVQASASEYTKENPLKLTIGFENSPTDSSVNCGFLFADMLAERSDGRIELTVYPSGEMGNAVEMFSLVREGSLDMVSLIPVTLGSFDPRLELSAIPGLYADLEQGEKFDKDGWVGELIEGYYNESGVTRLVHGEPNFYYFMTTKAAGPITGISTMKDKKLRIPSSPITKEFFEVAGAVPTTVAWGEIYTSLQRNVIDGMTNNLVWSVTAKFPEVATEISYLPVNYHTSDWLLNLNKWNSIPEDLQTIILECAEEIEGIMRTNWAATVEKNVADMEANGVTFTDVTDEEIAAFRSESLALMEDYIVSVWGQDILDRLRSEIIGG